MSAASALADWAISLDPTEDDLALADRALKDTVAVAVAARDHRILDVAARLGDAGRWAAASHVIDFDDLHMESTAHISTVCVPVALATGGGAPAYLAGAGVMARLGVALGWRHYSAGWHATTTSGALAAEFQEEDGFIPITYREHWEVIRRIDVASGTEWRCR
jgi:hypothetical protein